MDCANPPCSAADCTTCKTCRDPRCTSKRCHKQVSTLNSNYLPLTYQDVLNFRCERRAAIRCDICQELKPKASFGTSALQNKFKQTQNARCLDCSNPKCQATNCKTCPRCRNEKCHKKNRCTDSIATLNSQHLPEMHAEVMDFFCARCRFIKCVVKTTDGQFCSKERRSNKQAQAKRLQEHYKCGECQTWLFNQSALKANRGARVQ